MPEFLMHVAGGCVKQAKLADELPVHLDICHKSIEKRWVKIVL
jgi:hypothetical protein